MRHHVYWWAFLIFHARFWIRIYEAHAEPGHEIRNRFTQVGDLHDLHALRRVVENENNRTIRTPE